jgi:hypothetical protein
MATSHGGSLAAALQDLQHIFGARLHAMVAYGRPDAQPASSLALVESITAEDLDRCAAHAAAWHRAGCATPLLLTREEFAGSLDAFPIEYGEIIATHRVLFGASPFTGLTIRAEDVRRECETLVKSHLVHLRENYIESRGRQDDIRALVHDAAPGFVMMLRRLAHLDGVPGDTDAELSAYAVKRPGLDARLVGDVLALARQQGASGVDAMRLYPAYLAAVSQLWVFIDRWKAAGQ